MTSDYHDRLWQTLPEDQPLPLWRERLEIVLGEVRPGWRVLDLGCGDGRFSAAIAEAGAAVVGVDVSAEALGRARRRSPELEFRAVAPGGRLPFADAEFDCVFCSAAIAQVVDVAAFMSEVRRVLKPQGRLLLTTPYHGRLKNVVTAIHSFDEHFSPMGPQLRFFTKRTLGELAASFGFERIRLRAVGGPPLMREQIFLSAARGTYGVAG